MPRLNALAPKRESQRRGADERPRGLRPGHSPRDASRMDLSTLTFNSDGLIPVIAQDVHTGEVRMLAYANAEAVSLTLESRVAHFFSRSRNALWKKGESSGHTLHVVRVAVDCDRDALIYGVLPDGPTCHTGAESCFFGRLSDDSSARPLPTFFQVFEELEARRSATSSKSYTKSLLDAGVPKISEKIREESGELCEALAGESDERVVSEAADVLYHVMVGLLARGRTLNDVALELARRQGTSGHAEKAARPPK